MKPYAEVRMPRVVLYGRESFAAVGKQAAQLGTKALLVSDRVMEKLGYVETCRMYLKECGVEHVSYLDVNTEPTDVHVAESLELLQREGCNLIVALGGGSCIDAAKAVSILATNRGYIGDYMGGKKPIEHAGIPLIALPTTAGTGSEATSATVITNTKDDVKMMIKHPAFIPAVAIVDPLLTLSSPPHVTAATGIDALCHAVEAYLSRLAHPLTDTLALSAIGLINRYLRRAYHQGDDLEARENMALASLQAGIAFSNASVCLVHGMSRPIGAVFHVPHGVSNAMLLPAVLEYTKEAAVPRLADIARVLRPDLEGRSEEEMADATIREMKELCRELGIPNLKAWGIDEERFRSVAPKMAADAIASGSPGNNPKVPSHEEIVQLYHIAYDYRF